MLWRNPKAGGCANPTYLAASIKPTIPPILDNREIVHPHSAIALDVQPQWQ
jgi:hypothetical protein